MRFLVTIEDITPHHPTIEALKKAWRKVASQFPEETKE
jgi:hypothetical protein